MQTSDHYNDEMSCYCSECIIKTEKCKQHLFQIVLNVKNDVELLLNNVIGINAVSIYKT